MTHNPFTIEVHDDPPVMGRRIYILAWLPQEDLEALARAVTSELADRQRLRKEHAPHVEALRIQFENTQGRARALVKELRDNQRLLWVLTGRYVEEGIS